MSRSRHLRPRTRRGPDLVVSSKSQPKTYAKADQDDHSRHDRAYDDEGTFALRGPAAGNRCSRGGRSGRRQHQPVADTLNGFDQLRLGSDLRLVVLMTTHQIRRIFPPAERFHSSSVRSRMFEGLQTAPDPPSSLPAVKAARATVGGPEAPKGPRSLGASQAADGYQMRIRTHRVSSSHIGLCQSTLPSGGWPGSQD